MTPANQCGDAHKHEQGNIRSNSACILQPLSDVQPDDIQQYRDNKKGERNGEQERPILRERRAAPAHDICRHRSTGE